MKDFNAFKAALQLDEQKFWRLPGNVVGNDLYRFGKAVESFVATQLAGDDFNRANFDKIITMANNIKKQAKQFDDPESVPVSYQYKSRR